MERTKKRETSLRKNIFAFKSPPAFILFLFVAISPFLSPECFAQKKVLKVAMEIWPPFQYLDDNGKPAGLDIELTTAILKRAGHDVSFHIYP